MKASEGPFEIGNVEGRCKVWGGDGDIVASFPWVAEGDSEANALLFTRSRYMLALLRELAPTLGHYHGPLGGCAACQVEALLEDLKEVEM